MRINPTRMPQALQAFCLANWRASGRRRLGELPACDNGRQRGGIEQYVSKCGNVEKVIPLCPFHIIR
jgi:hypothetical protein